MLPPRDEAALFRALRAAPGKASALYNGDPRVGKFRRSGICDGLARDCAPAGILHPAMPAPSASPTPSVAEEAVGPAGQEDPLSGDWSEGLPGPRRAHGIPQPKRIALNGHAEPVQERILDAEEVLRTQFADEPAAAEPTPAFDDVTPAAPSPAFFAEPQAPEAAPPQPAAAAADAAPAEPAPTPWSEPVADERAVSDAAWDAPTSERASPPLPEPDAWRASAPLESAPEAQPAPPANELPPPLEPASAALPQADDAWSRPPAATPPVPDDTWSAPAAQPAEEWQADTASADFEEVRAPEAEAAPAAAADWSSLRTAPAAPAEASAEAWGAPPPVPAASEWSPAAPAAEPQWSAAATGELPAAEWSAPATPAPTPGPAWNSPAVGASALEQLDSQPPEAEPGAAKDLFGAVPSGGMLGGDDEDGFGPPEELASPEEVLRPLPIDHDDPDLLAAMAEPTKPAQRPQPLAAFKAPAQGALEVHGEHRVAIHTRGGRTLRGTVENIDLSKSKFPLAPQGGGEVEAIYHSDVKAIFFMLAPGERANGGDGARVRVTFADGRVIEGNREGAEAKHGWFLIPADAARTNTRRIYVAREAANEIEDG